MSLRYSVGGRSANTAATANHVAAALWNPSTAFNIYVREIWVTKTVATADHHQLNYITTRGTAGSTVTPDTDNDYTRQAAPPSGALLDLAAYSVQPTLQTPALARRNLPATIGSFLVFDFRDVPIVVRPGQGLAIGTPVATILQASDFTFVWDEL